MVRWLVVGISGVTCGGKSTLANKLHALYPKSQIICMDNYFLSPDDPRHLKVSGLNHNNWERLGAMDTDKWKHTVKYVLESNPECLPTNSNIEIPNFIPTDDDFKPTIAIPTIKQGLLILDGFLALNDPWTVSQCNLKFYCTLTKEQCWERRSTRHYDPPDIPGYFESCIWPEHVKMKEQVHALNPDVILLDGTKSRTELIDTILINIASAVEHPLMQKLKSLDANGHLGTYTVNYS